MAFEPAPITSKVDPILAEYIGRELRRLGRAAVLYDDVNRGRMNVVAPISASYVVRPLDEVIAVSLSSVAIACHLPPVRQYPGRRLHLKKLDAGAQVLSFAAASGETIDGATSRALSSQYSTVQVVAGATQWMVL